MQKDLREPIQSRNETAFLNPGERGADLAPKSVQETLKSLNLAVLGLVVMAGWLSITMKSGLMIYSEAIPAYLIVCCLLFFKAIEQKRA